MSSDKFHRAARDGYLPLLKEATKQDCNHPDEDGLTPTSYAAYEGNLDALRILVGRGGDPDKCDYFGSTCLHCAAERGHLNCVSFLINFGVNLWALNNDGHTAKDLAAINSKDEILRYIDTEASRLRKQDPKKVMKLEEKSRKDCEKRVKEFEKIQTKAEKKRQQEESRLQKEMEIINNAQNKDTKKEKKSFFSTISKGSLALLPGIISSNHSNKPLHPKNQINSKKFSELTQNVDGLAGSKKTVSGIQKRILGRKFREEQKRIGDFKVRADEGGGKKSVRNLSGLQRDSEIMFVPSGSLSSGGSNLKRGKISDVFSSDEAEDYQVALERKLMRTKSVPDFVAEPHILGGHFRGGSLFDRPGFGSVAFRSSAITATLSGIQQQNSLSEESEGSFQPSVTRSSDDLNSSIENNRVSSSRKLTSPWEEEDLPSSDEDSQASPLYIFLQHNGLSHYVHLFNKGLIDMESVMLLNDQDLEALRLPLGPRRKLLRALNDRRLAISTPGEITDVRL